MDSVKNVIDPLRQLRADWVHVEIAVRAPVEEAVDRFATEVADEVHG